MLLVNGVTFINAGKKILNDVSFSIERQKKIIVGENGTGKTTLLEIVAGNLLPDSGTVINKGTFAYVPQEIKALDRTGIEEIESAFPEIKRIEEKLNALERENNFGDEYNKLLMKYDETGGYTYKQRIQVWMDKIGLSMSIASRKMRDMSGGERTKCEITKALLSEPDLLIMDEPTNYLDIETIELLEDILKKFQGGFKMNVAKWIGFAMVVIGEVQQDLMDGKLTVGETIKTADVVADKLGYKDKVLLQLGKKS
jgi:ATP-binding cassette subfamily F protein 3